MRKLCKIPKTFSYDGRLFEQHAAVAARDNELLAQLKIRADKLLSEKSPCITDRRTRAISGDIHDYSSFGPYWWPNPNTKDGLPYIRRDGEFNPDSIESITFSSLFSSVEILTLAAYYLEDNRYADKAVENISSWYINADTAMKPHLEYAQAIPGICNGRGTGLIDCTDSYKLFDCVGLLEAMDAIPSDVVSALKDWYGKFLDWMLTSETGVDEDASHNNHGSWYDVQVASTALFLDRRILARRQLSLAYERRILKHIDLEGKQPHELARTNAIKYSTFNLKALMLIANLAQSAECKLNMWQEKREGGDVALRSALDYLKQFARSLDGFEYSQLDGKPDPEGAALLMTMAAKHFPKDGYGKEAEELYKPYMLWRLLPL